MITARDGRGADAVNFTATLQRGGGFHERRAVISERRYLIYDRLSLYSNCARVLRPVVPAAVQEKTFSFGIND